MAVARRPRVKPVALPSEHGAWGFLLEPALLGLLIVFSWPGLALVVAALGALLVQQPLSLALADARRGAVYARTRLAWAFAAGYGAVLLAAVLAAVSLAGTALILVPALIAAPLALVQLAYDARNRGRELAAELAGATAMGALASCMALAAGWPPAVALVLWLALAARTVPSIVYVRARLALERGQQVDARPAVALHGASLLLAVGLGWSGLLPLAAIFAFALLFGRCVLGLSRHRRPVKAKIVGMRELAYGGLLVASIALGYAVGA